MFHHLMLEYSIFNVWDGVISKQNNVDRCSWLIGIPLKERNNCWHEFNWHIREVLEKRVFVKQCKQYFVHPIQIFIDRRESRLSYKLASRVRLLRLYCLERRLTLASAWAELLWVDHVSRGASIISWRESSAWTISGNCDWFRSSNDGQDPEE